MTDDLILGRRRTRPSMPLSFLVLCGAPFLVGLDLFVVNVAFPAISAEFPTSSLSDLSWVLNAYVITYAALLLPAGRCADALGARRVLILGLILFTAGSVAAAMSPSLPVLIAARIVQAVGGAALTPASLGLLLTIAPEEKRAAAVRIWVASSALGSALGPTLGGLLTELSWRWVFIINAPAGVLLVALAFTCLPRDRRTATEPVGVLASLLIVIAAGALCLALVQGGSWGWLSASTLTCLLVFAAASIGLVAYSRAGRTPLVPSAVWRVPSFVRATIAMLLFSMSFAAGLLALSLWLQQTWGYSALRTGLAIAPGPLMVPVFALAGGRFLDRFRPGSRAAVGSALWALGTVMILVSVGRSSDYVVAILPGWIVAGAGVGIAMPAMLVAATIGLPARFASSGSAVVNVTRQLGSVFGVSLLIAVLAAPALAPRSAFGIAWWIAAALAVAAAGASLRIGRAPSSPRVPACQDEDQSTSATRTREIDEPC